MSDRPTLPSPPPFSASSDGISLHEEGWKSRRIQRTHQQLVAWFLDRTRETLGAMIDQESGYLRSMLLDAGLDSYTQGSEYARRIDRWMIEGYLSCVAKKVPLPSVSLRELTQILEIPGGPSTSEEVAVLCRALGLPLEDND